VVVEKRMIGKRLKMAKRVLCLVFAFILSINSFAAIVSDNDGSAFITKAEFDSLKNDFQSQLDQYNTSIDSKIDDAIASYLAGIKVTKTTSLNVLYPNPEGSYANVKWTSSNTYSYDNVENKYWHYYCDFEQPNGEFWSKYLYEYGTDRRYNTLYYDATTETYLFKKVQFNLNAWLRFMRFILDWDSARGGNFPDTRQMKVAGRVRWSYDFWPTTLYENQHYKRETHSGRSYGYSCMYYPTVTVEDQDTKNYIIAPNSTATTYVYVPGKELKGDNGAVMDDTNNYSLVADIWDHTSIDSYGVYRDMLVNKSQSIVPSTTNQLKLNWLLSYDVNKLPIESGILLAKSTNDADKVKITLSCSHAGVIDVAYYNNASGTYKIQKTFNVDAGDNTLKIDAGIKKNDNIYILYRPTNTAVTANLDNFDVVIEKEE
jgi:hypothetical protein